MTTPSGIVLRYVGNPIVTAILRSPLHGMLSRSVILITVRGRRTGKRYTVPVGYVHEGGTLAVLVADRQRKTWWRNLVGGAPVEVLLGGRRMQASGEALTFEHHARQFTSALRNYIAHRPRGARAVGIKDVEDLNGLRSAAAGVTMVRIRLPKTTPSTGDVTASNRARM